jgi:hypothetical protein
MQASDLVQKSAMGRALTLELRRPAPYIAPLS